MSRLASALSWTAGARIGVQVAQLASGVVLARVLAPRDFGLAAIAFVFVGLAGLLSDAGVGLALVQKKELSDDDASTTFWLNFGLGAALAAVVAVVSGFVASGYGDPELVPLLLAASLMFVLNVGVVPLALLERALRFKAIAVCEVAAGVVGIATSVAAALLGLGAMALVVAPVVTNLVRSVLLMLASRWLPRATFNRASARQLVSFSGFYTASNVVYYARANIDKVVIGLVAGPVVLGLYTRAQTLTGIPTLQVREIATRIVLPTLADRRRRGEDVAAYFRQAYRASAMATIGLLGLLGCLAPTLVPFLYGDQWHASVPLLQLLCVAGCLQALLTPCSWAYIVQGRTRDMFRWSLIATSVVSVGIVCGVQWGARGVAWSLIISTALLVVPCWLSAVAVLGMAMTPAVRQLVPLVGAVAAGTGVAVLVHLEVVSSPRLWADIASCLCSTGAALLTLVLLQRLVRDRPGRAGHPDQAVRDLHPASGTHEGAELPLHT